MTQETNQIQQQGVRKPFDYHLSRVLFISTILQMVLFVALIIFVSWVFEEKIGNTWGTGGLVWAFWFFIPWLFSLVYLSWRAKSAKQLFRFTLILAILMIASALLYAWLVN